MSVDEVINHRLGALEVVVREMAEAVVRLVALEERHVETREGLVRAHDRIDDHEDRLRAIEPEMPTLTLTRKWVLAVAVGVWAIFGSIVVAVAVNALSAKTVAVKAQ